MEKRKKEGGESCGVRANVVGLEIENDPLWFQEKLIFLKGTAQKLREIFKVKRRIFLSSFSNFLLQPVLEAGKKEGVSRRNSRR